MRWGIVLCLCVLAQGALADLPATRPEARPAPAVAPVAAELAAVLAPDGGGVRPQPRPGSLAPAPLQDAAAALRPAARPAVAATGADRAAAPGPLVSGDSGTGDLALLITPRAVPESLRPALRPAGLSQRVAPAPLRPVRGQLCGDPAILGDVIGTIDGRGACGVENAVKVRSVAGVSLQPNPTINCDTASALKAWVAQSAKPALAGTGGGLTGLRVASHYACRNRNNAASGRLSEHAFGRAVDIAGFRLASGREITVLRDWGRGAAGDKLQRLWRDACGPFGTVLGPRANAAHRDHFHFDTARYRSGSYCR